MGLMLRAFVAIALVLILGFAGVTADLASRDAGLASGIALVKEGDFESALLKLDESVRRLESGPKPSPELAVGYLYLGVAYLELEQELSARSRFRQAAAQDPAMRLDPREFSPQVIRFFESARQEAERTASAGRTPSTATKPAAKGGGNAVPFVLGGGAVAGIVLATRAGGEGASPANPTTTTTATTTTTTTTTLPASSCRYGMSPSTQDVAASGGTGTCSVTASPAGCGWHAESTEDWLTITGAAVGVGNGPVSWTAAANTRGSRKGRIRLVEDRDVRCEIQQGQGASGVVPSAATSASAVPSVADGRSAATPAATVSVSSQLEMPDGSGQVVLNGQAVFYQRPGRGQSSAAARPGPGRLEATIVTASGRPGTWRFEMSGGFEPGSLRAIAGEVVMVTADAIVFRIVGRVGERVVFGFQMK